MTVKTEERGITMKHFVGALVLLTSLCPFRLDAADVSDPRFFGKYCEAKPQRLCKTIKVKVCLPWVGCGTVHTREECVTIENVDAAFDHTGTPQGGLVVGNGTFTLDGDPAAFVMAGAVVQHGRMKGSANIPGLGREFGRTRLSSDGLELKVYASGETITLRKDVCGNNAPSVSLSHASLSDPSGLESVATFGKTERFLGEVTADEDPGFPPQRMVLESDRDGLLSPPDNFVGPTPPRHVELYTNTLSLGRHVITFTATDSGGLSASASKVVHVGNVLVNDETVDNRPPDKPMIVQPLSRDTIVATGQVLLHGTAYDFEDSLLYESEVLPDEALTWRASQNGGRLQLLGTGKRLTTSFDTPGSVTLRLTATDSAGSERFTERSIKVQRFAGNTQPRVTIVIPDELQTAGDIAAVLISDDISFVGTVTDAEDTPDKLELGWRARAIDSRGAPIPAGPAAFDKAFGTNDTAPTITLNRDGLYRITFTATDTGGLVSSKSIKILMLPEPIIVE